MLAALAILLFLLCLRVWGLTHTDDAMWLLRSYTSFFGTIDDWARMQGRLWAYVSGTLIMHALVAQGTLYGELLRLGSFVLFFTGFHVTVAVYCGRRIALLCATFFLAFFALKWDGSILTTYPLITWPAGIAFTAAVLAGRAYVRHGTGAALAGAGLLLFCSLFNNEGVTITFMLLFALSIFANASQADPSARRRIAGIALPQRSARLLLVFLASAAAYSVLYLLWRHLHPSVYNGNALAPFNARYIGITLYHFSTGGSALHELMAPLQLPYTATYHEGRQVSYALAQYRRGMTASPLAIAVAALVALLVWRLLSCGAGVAFDAPAGKSGAAKASALRCALAGGLVLAILPIVPVALAGMYQTWAIWMHVRAYSHTVLAYFGWSLVLAALVAALAGRLQRYRAYPALLLLLALASGALAALVYRADDAIAADMRPESGRWALVNRAMAVNRAVFRSDVLWIPGLAQRTQYGQLYASYWQEYVKARFGAGTAIEVKIPDTNEQMNGIVMVDYAYDAAGRRMPALFTALHKETLAGPFLAGRTAVDLDGGAAADYVLEFRSAGAGAQRIPVAALAAAPGLPGLFVLKLPPGTDPASVSLLRSDAPAAAALCMNHLPQGLRIDFKQPRMAHPALDPAAYLDAGWYEPEAEAVWSRGLESHLRFPRALLPSGALRLDLNISSFSGLGFAAAGVQQVALRINDKPFGKWDFTPGASVPIELDLPADLLAGAGVLDLHFSVSQAMVPKDHGLNPQDNRTLGLLLRSITFLPSPRK